MYVLTMYKYFVVLILFDFNARQRLRLIGESLLDLVAQLGQLAGSAHLGVLEQQAGHLSLRVVVEYRVELLIHRVDEELFQFERFEVRFYCCLCVDIE